MNTLKKRAVCYGLVILLGLLSALPNILPPSISDSLPQWYVQNQLSLGLDLQGGSYLLLAVDSEALMRDHNQQTADDLRPRLREAGIRHSAMDVSARGLGLAITDPARLDEAETIARGLSLNADGPRRYDLETTDSQLRLMVNPAWQEAALNDAVEQSLEVVRNRLDESGMVEPGITRQGQDRIEVQLPGVSDPQRLRELLGTTAKMSFHWLDRGEDLALMTLPGQTADEQYRVEKSVAMEGRHVKDARLSYHPDTGEPMVNFRLDSSGGRLFGEMTRNNVGKALAVVLDERVITAPVIRTPILGGSGEISGGFTSSEAADLAIMLRAGALPAELVVMEQRTVGPSLGSDAIAMGLLSGITGGLLVLAFMVIAYGLWGFIAWIGLSINTTLIFAILSLLGATLTLPGIAGIILGIGMAVDANILINERIREESLQGRTARQALEIGFSKAWATILDSNVTTLIAVSLLFMIGSGPVQGFAVTMGLGLLCSMFTAIAVTRLLMEWRVSKMGRRPFAVSGPGILQRFSERYGKGSNAINFMRAGMAGLVISTVLSTASLVLMFKPGLDYGIDFSGGALVELTAAGLDIERLRSGVENSALPTVDLQEFGSDGQFQLRLPLQAADARTVDVLEQMKAVVMELAPDATIDKAEMVGPRISGDFADLSILAVLIAGIGMLAYLWYRFENHFALAAIITIGLDLTKTIGFFVLTGIEFNLTAVAALLALIGYSVNDKVVVFDRIRENLLSTPDEALPLVINKSISATLTRTLLTSGSTFLALLPMALFGGAAVSSFAWPMLFGIVIGTSSSIFIASPVFLMLGRRREKLGLPQVRSVETGLSEEELLRP